MNKRLALTFIFLTIVIDAMGVGLIMPVMPDLLQEVLGSSLANAALWGGILTAAFAVMQFLCGPAIGNLSDRYGRKPVLLGSLLVVGVDYVIMGFTGSIWILLLGRIIGGIASATQSTASAYIADISDEKERAQNFGLVGAAFGIGFILGPMMGGLLAGFGPRAPFFAAAALAFLNFGFGALILSETLREEIRRKLTWARINPFGAIAQVGSLSYAKGLMAVFFFHSLAFHAYPSTWAFFTKESFAWSPGMIGLSLGAFGLTLALVQGVLIRYLVPKYGEWNILLMGIILSVLADFAVAFAPTGTILLALIPMTGLSFLVTPTLQGLISKATPEDAQGELQGVLTSIGAIAIIIGPLMMTFAFGYFISEVTPVYLPGAPFVLAGLLDMISVLIAVYLLRQAKAGLKTVS